MLKECGQQLFCSLAVAANNMTSDLVWLHIFANPRRWTYFTTWKIQKSGPQRKQRKQRKHLVAIHGLALHTVSHVINEAHRPSLADFADFAVHILQLLQLTHINHSSSKHKAQSTRKAQGRQEFDIDRFDRSIDMVWHSQYVQYVFGMSQYWKVSEMRDIWNMFQTCSKHVPYMFQTCQGFSSRTTLGLKVPICCLFCLLPGLQNLQQQHLPLHRSPVKMAPCENFNSEMFEMIHMWFSLQDFMVQKPLWGWPQNAMLKMLKDFGMDRAQTCIMSIMSRSRSSSHGYGHLGVL